MSPLQVTNSADESVILYILAETANKPNLTDREVTRKRVNLAKAASAVYGKGGGMEKSGHIVLIRPRRRFLAMQMERDYLSRPFASSVANGSSSSLIGVLGHCAPTRSSIRTRSDRLSHTAGALRLTSSGSAPLIFFLIL
eukprot:6207741-Pleurochrysis_carterae.AAC.6